MLLPAGALLSVTPLPVTDGDPEAALHRLGGTRVGSWPVPTASVSKGMEDTGGRE